MTPSRLRPIRAVLTALALFGLIGCILEGEKAAKRGSEVENEMHGILVALDGQPVQGAKVKAVPAAPRVAKRSGASAADSDSVVTDAEGRYAFRSLESGRYNLFGDYQDGALVVLIPDVDRSDTGAELDLGTDTLRAPGRIRGRVLLGDYGKEGVLAYVPGTSYLAVSDDSGRFVIGGVPQGVHLVRYSAAGFVIEADSGVVVRSGLTTDLPAKRLAHDPALPPPAPTGLKAVYDTLNERVTLTWDSVPVSDLDGYVIYRDKPSFLDPQVVPDGFTRAASFVDTPMVPDGMGSQILVYRIKSRDKEVNLSLSYSSPAEVTVVSRQWVTTHLDVQVADARAGTASLGDIVRVTVSYSNPTRNNSRIDWYLDGPMPTRSVPGSGLSGSDTLIWIAERTGPVNFSVRITDEAGATWTGERELQVLQDAPRVSAGVDTSVSIGDRVELRGKGSDGFGRIVKWEWDIGGGGDFSMAGTDTAFMAPSSPVEEFPCILRATDDDGQAAADTVIIRVVLDPPVVNAGPDVVVSLGDSIHLKGAAADRFGSVEKWEWDIGGTGAFVATPGGGISFLAPADPRGIPCILRVTDDDGVSAMDSLHVTVSADPPMPKAEADFYAAFPGDTIVLTGGRSSDGFGKIVEWSWKIGSGAVIPQPTPTLSLVVPPSPSDFLVCRLRVKDDDGQTAEDSIRIRVYPDTGWQPLHAPSPFGEATSAKSCVFQDKLWVLTAVGSQVKVWNSRNGLSWNLVHTLQMNVESLVHFKLEAIGPVLYLIAFNEVALESKFTNPVLATTDGVTWVKQSDMPFGPRDGMAVAAFGGKLWAIPGASTDGIHADIWSSPDGKLWTRQDGSGPTAWEFAGKLEAWNGRLWFVGGSASANTWSSSDGLSWRNEGMPDLPSTGLYGFVMEDAGSSLVLAGGQIRWESRYFDGVMSTTDGVAWQRLPAPLGGMFEAGVTYFRGHLWVIHASTTGPTTIWRGSGSP